MNFKKPKQDIICDIEQRVHSEIDMHLSMIHSAYVGSVTDVVRNAITSGIKAGMIELIDSIYTDDEFETDIGLKS